MIAQGQTMIPSSRNNLNTGNPFVCIPKQLPELDSDNNFLPYPENKIWIWIIPHHHKHSNNLFISQGSIQIPPGRQKLICFRCYTICLILITGLIRLYIRRYSRQISQSLPSLPGSPIMIFNCNSISDCIRLMIISTYANSLFINMASARFDAIKSIWSYQQCTNFLMYDWP